MPIYEYRCEKCGHQQDAVRRIENRHNTPPCDRCEVSTNLIISPVRGKVTADMNHFDVGLGIPITSARQLAYERDKRGLVDSREVYGQGMPSLPPPPKNDDVMKVPGELYDSMKREGFGDMLDNVEIDRDLA